MAHHVAVQGDFERSIRLEEDIEIVYDYFTDFNYILPRLPEIERVLRYGDGRYRMVFGADDGRGHEMSIVFDIKHELIENQHIKMLALPLTDHDLQKDARMQNSKGPIFPGRFSGETVFRQHPKHVEVVYRARIELEIEVPRFLNFIPKPMLQQLGDTLMRVKLHSVGDGMAQRMAEDFAEWCELNRAKFPVPARVGAPPVVSDGQIRINAVELPNKRPANELN